MDKNKSITVIIVSLIFAASFVAVTAIYFSSKNQSITESKIASKDKNINIESTKVDTSGTNLEAALSVTVDNKTEQIRSATCEVPQGVYCNLWGYLTSSNSGPEIIDIYSNAKAEKINETGKIQYTWNLENKTIKNMYISLLGSVYDSEGNHLFDSTTTRL